MWNTQCWRRVSPLHQRRGAISYDSSDQTALYIRMLGKYFLSQCMRRRTFSASTNTNTHRLNTQGDEYSQARVGALPHPPVRASLHTWRLKKSEMDGWDKQKVEINVRRTDARECAQRCARSLFRCQGSTPSRDLNLPMMAPGAAVVFFVCLCIFLLRCPRRP